MIIQNELEEKDIETMKSLQLRETYAKGERKEYPVLKYSELSEYFSGEINISKSSNSSGDIEFSKTGENNPPEIRKIISESGKVTFLENDTSKEIEKMSDLSRVWLLFASNDKSNWVSLQVGQSKNNVAGEIEDVIKYLFFKYEPASEFANSAFYEKVCPKTTGSKDKRELLYSKIGREYKYFRICLLDVDKYLGTKPSNSNNNRTDAERIVEICKNQYAEAKIAFATLAVYWTLYSSGIDGQTIAFMQKILEEKKKVNLNKVDS